MTILDLAEEIRFVGRALFDEEWQQVLVIVRTGLEMELFGVNFDIYMRKNIPRVVEGCIGDWAISAEHCSHVTYHGVNAFTYIDEKLGFNASQTKSISQADRKKHWWHMTIRPKLIDFTKTIFKGVPGEWGIVFYPSGTEKAVYTLLHEGSRSPRGLPKLFAGVDSSVYFRNRQTWTVPAMRERIETLTATLVPFVGSLVTYTSLVGRHDNDVKYARAKLISNPHSFVCFVAYNGHASVRKPFLNDFRDAFGKIIDQVHSNPKRERIKVVLSYFRELYTALHDETRLAFAFQLMESLALYTGTFIKNPAKNAMKYDLLRQYERKLCPTCFDIIQNEIQPETDDFDQYIDRALDVVLPEEKVGLTSPMIKKIAKQYRNQVFHGNFFEDMTEIDKIVDDLPENYRTDLVVILQAVVSVIGVHLLLGIDFDVLRALKARIE